MDVPDSVANIAFGALLAGRGTVWVDDLRFEDIGPEGTGIPVTATPGWGPEEVHASQQ